MKKYLQIFILLLVLGIGVYSFGSISRNNNTQMYIDENIKQVSRTNGKYFEVYQNGNWNKTFLKGVNIGTTKPGYSTGELGITKEDYLRWFKQIKDMNANVIRVYTLQNPEFYEAIYQFNKSRKDPLYLIHGVSIDDKVMNIERNAFTSRVIDTFKEDISTVINVIHGNANIELVNGTSNIKYKNNISQYVIGYILGGEWDPYFAELTNIQNKGMKEFNGDWLYTENAQPIEIFLAECGDYAIKYESEKYNMQKPISFANWQTTDIIDHSDDIDEANRIINIDESTIKSKDTFKSGLFVSYHIYPYYPDFLNYDEKYKSNSYKTYLEDLISYYKDRPVIVSEFGVPTSRGISNEDLSRGFNEGMIEETQQGEINKQLIESIHSTGYAGAIVFSWQDEWFKQSWNTMNLTDSKFTQYWLDKMTSEQSFGILSFDPGEQKSVAYIDGSIDEWKDEDIVSAGKDTNLYMKSDEAYVYFRINKKNLDLDKEEVIIPIDITNNSGSKKLNGYNVNFNKDADFTINIKDKDNSQILVNEYYDINNYLFNEIISKEPNSDKFNVVKQTVQEEGQTPITKNIVKKKSVDVGKLIYGDSNPNSKDFNSLADFIVNGDDIEIRIPWLMLNITNPSQKLALDDFNNLKEIKDMKFKNINVGAYVINQSKVEDEAIMKSYTWDNWDMPTYHERLKESYYIIKDTFNKLS